MNINNYNVKDLELAYQKIYNNAKELLEESEILFEKKKYSRAFTLSHLSSEELSKLPLLYRVATDVHFKIKVNWKQVNKDLRDHEGKIRRKYMMTLLVNPSLLNDKEKFLQELREIYDLATLFNEMKNISIYAGISPENNKFDKPSSIITEKMAKSSIKMSKLYLDIIELADFHINGFSEILGGIKKEDYLLLTKEKLENFFS